MDDLLRQYGWTPLHLAAVRGDSEAATDALANGDVADRTTKLGWMAHHGACAHGRADVLAALIDAGAPLDAATAYGWTALDVAEFRVYPPVVELLRQHGARRTAIFEQHPLCEAVSCLPEHYRGKFRTNNGPQAAILMLAGIIDLVEILLSVHAVREHAIVLKGLRRAGDGPEKLCRFHGLHLAASAGNLEGVRLLLSHGANARRLDSERRTALDLAMSAGHEAVAAVLVRAGCPETARGRGDIQPITISYANDDQTTDPILTVRRNSAAIDCRNPSCFSFQDTGLLRPFIIMCPVEYCAYGSDSFAIHVLGHNTLQFASAKDGELVELPLRFAEGLRIVKRGRQHYLFMRLQGSSDGSLISRLVSLVKRGSVAIGPLPSAETADILATAERLLCRSKIVSATEEELRADPAKFHGRLIEAAGFWKQGFECSKFCGAWLEAGTAADLPRPNQRVSMRGLWLSDGPSGSYGHLGGSRAALICYEGVAHWRGAI